MCRQILTRDGYAFADVRPGQQPAACRTDGLQHRLPTQTFFLGFVHGTEPRVVDFSPISRAVFGSRRGGQRLVSVEGEAYVS